ncbi:protein kinase domain-containing protein [Leisingera sp. JC1]|uniref:protein kinase domain-containing protein n=1 Tax=Leisingera sp. JC1 TaxID=1855282 RepID=UPI0020C7CD57|nr:protein kinase [Leisingera sp. JC1]
MLRAFLREAHLLARAEHPGIVGVHQVFKENQTAYIAMEFIDGLDLLTVREEQPERLTAPVLRQILTQALEALGCLHGLGILHRDISPDNLLQHRCGQPLGLFLAHGQQVKTVNELHRDIGGLVFLEDLMHTDDAGVLGAGQQMRLAKEGAQHVATGFGVFRRRRLHLRAVAAAQPRGKALLDHHPPFQAVARQIGDAEAAADQRALNLVLALQQLEAAGQFAGLRRIGGRWVVRHGVCSSWLLGPGPEGRGRTFKLPAEWGMFTAPFGQLRQSRRISAIILAKGQQTLG